MLEKLKISEKVSSLKGSTPPPSPPPPYSTNGTHPTLSLDKLQLDQVLDKPSADQCVAHLKLLKAFAGLRHDIVHRDGLFAITDSMIELVEKRSLEPRSRTTYLSQLQEKRWAVYVARAADRFERWYFGPLKAQFRGSRDRLSQADLDRGSSYDSTLR